MTDLEKNPAIIKLLEYAKRKRTIGLGDLDDLLPEDLMSPETIPDILDILEGAGIQIQKPTPILRAAMMKTTDYWMIHTKKRMTI